MLGNLFKRKSVPTNDGDSTPRSLEKLQFTKTFELELSNMEDSPVYALTHQISIGSEIGNIVIADPSVSPRHATFLLEDDVVSVIDHGSVAGTFVNDKKLEAGKSIILEESDVIRVGDLEVRIKVGRVANKKTEPAASSDHEEDQPVISKPQKTTKSSTKIQKKGKGKKQELALSGTNSSTNAIVRALAVFSDLILSYAFLVVFLPFDEFRGFLEFLPSLIAETLDIEWESLFSTLSEDFGFVKEMLTDAMSMVSSTFQIVPLLIVFVLNRLSTTLLFGVSLSEFMLGMRAEGNKIWARIGGVLRVLIGVITWPFLIFDVPAVISKRTLKEFMTFTNTYVPSKFVSILGILLYLPLILAFAIVSPLMQGLEVPEPVIVNDSIDQRVKVKVPDGQAVNGEAIIVSDQSKTLNLALEYNSSDVLLIPNVKFQGQKNKLSVKNGLIFYQRDLQRGVELEVYKNFDLKQLLGIGMKGNFFLYDKYPEIYNFVYEPEEVNIAFRKAQDQRSEAKFANEVIQFTKTAFGLGLDNAAEFLQTETLLLKGFLDYRASLLSLIEYKDFDQIGFVKIGNIIFLKVSFLKQKPFDLIIPLMKGQGRIFKVNFDKKENLAATSSKFYKFNLDKANWLPFAKKEPGEVMTALEAYDFFSTENFKELLRSSTKAQGFYAYFFETSSQLMRKGDPVELELWKSRAANVLGFLEMLPVQDLKEGEENPKEKLLQNFKDMVDALENKNYDYFGIVPTETV